jgi:tRNA-dihydrouridine synthase C
MVTDPGLALAIKMRDEVGSSRANHLLPWETLQPRLAEFWQIVNAHLLPVHRAGRLKQWLNFLRRRYLEAQTVYATIRALTDPEQVSRVLFAR